MCSLKIFQKHATKLSLIT